jgi:glycolate oxidase FAD binding subunit
MSVTANLAAKLAEAVGAHHIISAPEELAEYAIDGMTPAAIARPASANEVAELVKFAIAENLAVVPVGSRSKCEMGMAPVRYDLALDMTAMREVAHYDAGDMTLSVDAGMPLRELESFLRSHGQFLPLGVPCFESTTAGGAIASGIDSVLRQQYGTARDFLIGAEFVDGTGQLCKSGGRVVKNVTGYDLQKLLIGSLGTLGVITRLNFRTFPLPAASAGYLAAFAKRDAALEYRDRIRTSGIPLTNLEVISPDVATIIRAILQQSEQQVPMDFQEDVWSVYASFEGVERVVSRISAELEQLARQTGAQDSQPLKGLADDTIGGMLREAFEWLRWAAPATVLLRLVVCGTFTEVIGELARAAEASKLRSALLLRSTGIVYLALFSENETELLVPAKQLYLTAAALTDSHGGHAAVLHAPLEVKGQIAAARPERRDAALQERVKQAFDPLNIFAPGRVVGGI